MVNVAEERLIKSCSECDDDQEVGVYNVDGDSLLQIISKLISYIIVVMDKGIKFETTSANQTSLGG